MDGQDRRTASETKESRANALVLCREAKFYYILCIQKLLGAANMNDNCLKVLLENDPTGVQVGDKDGTTYVSFSGTDTTIKCQSLENLTTILKNLNESISSTPNVGDTLETSLLDLDAHFLHESENNIIPSVQKIAHNFADKIGVGSDDVDYRNSVGATANTCRSEAMAISDNALNEIVGNSSDLSDLSVSPTSSDGISDDQSSDESVVGGCFSDFRNNVLRLWKELKERYETKSTRKSQFDLVYFDDTKRDLKVVPNASFSEAKLQAFQLKDICKIYLPIVFIASQDYQSSTVAQNGSFSGAGKEQTPTILANLHSEHRKFSVTFYIDTGADSGSVGYNYEIIKHFILTVIDVNNCLEPAVLCKISNDIITEGEVELFDVDGNPNWNAVGLATLKNYRICMDTKENLVEMRKRENVTVRDTGETVEVIFRKTVTGPPPQQQFEKKKANI